jgi:hypothetical protein
MSFAPCFANVLFQLKNQCPQTGKSFMNNEKTKFLRQVAKVDLV